MDFTYKVVTLRDYFYLDSAACLVFSAFRNDDEVDHVESKHVQAYVVGTIICAVSFLEVSINSLFEGDFRRSSRKAKFSEALKSVWSEGFERQPTAAKYQIALALAHGKAFDTGSEPYQSAHALINLRNVISHPKQIIASEDEQKRLENLLKGKYPFRKPGSPHDEFFPACCLSPACAAWALFTAARFVKEFDRRLPASARFNRDYLDSYIATAERLLKQGYKKRESRLFNRLARTGQR